MVLNQSRSDINEISKEAWIKYHIHLKNSLPAFVGIYPVQESICRVFKTFKSYHMGPNYPQ